ncbi:site-2 protease family protein [Candidatus Margulisiibacteriota bacterium]
MTFLFYALIAVILLYSIILHEIAHGKVAEMMGDPTAKMYGRLTLNPIPHLDPFGTALPVLLLLLRAPIVFGWAKPVPINPYNFSDYKKGMIWVSAAGVLTNLLIAWVFATVLKFLPVPSTALAAIVQEALDFGVVINIVLAVFNLLPIPPLDGSRLFSMLLPYQYSQYIDRMEPFGFFILIFIFMSGLSRVIILPIIRFIYNLMMFRIF